MPFPFFAASQGAVTSCACGEGGVGGEIEEVFSKYDVNKSGTLSAADLGKAALDIYNVYLSKSHCNVLLKAADVDSSGALSLAEFTTVAEKFVASLPEIVTATAGTKEYYFVSFGCAEALGIDLYDTVDEDGKGKGVLVVEGVKGVAAEAGVLVGSVITYLHDEKLPLGFTQEDLAKKVGALKALNANFVIGFDVVYAAENAKIPKGSKGSKRRSILMNEAAKMGGGGMPL